MKCSPIFQRPVKNFLCFSYPHVLSHTSYGVCGLLIHMFHYQESTEYSCILIHTPRWYVTAWCKWCPISIPLIKIGLILSSSNIYWDFFTSVWFLNGWRHFTMIRAHIIGFLKIAAKSILFRICTVGWKCFTANDNCCLRYY